MAMRGFIGLSLTAVLAAGCGAAPQIGMTEGAMGLRCPDPNTDCTVSNGGGVYTEELGFAGIGANELMITHFINLAGGGVSVRGRAFDATTNTWQIQAGSVYYANYAGKQKLTVLSVTESLTVPTWTLADPSTSSNLTVTGSDLLNLQVVISLDRLYTLDWNSATVETLNATIHKFNMRWQLTGSTTPPTQYCYRADWTDDAVVFQQGMIVNPVTAMVTRDASTAPYVTLSCRYGAPATVRLWGYPYRTPADTNFFDAGLHMKRASYCGDESFYTKAGTQILIWDSLGINHDAMTKSEIEAWWTPTGASCIGPRRHWEQTYDGATFDGICNGVPLPSCSSQPVSALADAASPPGP